MASIKNQDPDIQLTQASRIAGLGEAALRRGIRAAVLGPSSAGRSEQAEKLAEKYCVCHVTPDEMLEREAASGSELGFQIQEFTKEDKPLTDDMILTAFSRQLDNPECRHGYILDGFPRTIEEAKKVDKVLDEKHTPIDTVVELQKHNKGILNKLFASRNQVGKYYSGRGCYTEVDAGRPFNEVLKKIDNQFGQFAKNPQVDLQQSTY